MSGRKPFDNLRAPIEADPKRRPRVERHKTLYQRLRDKQLQDPEFRSEYERARHEIAQTDAGLEPTEPVGDETA